MWRASQGGAFAACEGGGLEESLPTLWGVFRVFFWGIGLGCHEDSVCPVEDPPVGVRFEDMDGGLFGRRVQVVPRWHSAETPYQKGNHQFLGGCAPPILPLIPHLVRWRTIRPLDPLARKG